MSSRLQWPSQKLDNVRSTKISSVMFTLHPRATTCASEHHLGFGPSFVSRFWLFLNAPLNGLLKHTTDERRKHRITMACWKPLSPFQNMPHLFNCRSATKRQRKQSIHNICKLSIETSENCISQQHTPDQERPDARTSITKITHIEI